jgi:hypothetical protein
VYLRVKGGSLTIRERAVLTDVETGRTVLLSGAKVPARHEEPAMTETTPRLSHRETFVQVQQDLAMKLERIGASVDAQREIVTRLQLQLENEIRSLVAMETDEATIVREMDFAWEAQADFESMELERQHEQADALLVESAAYLEDMAREREDMED